ncbi:MAG: hypothetical protein WC350_06165 [Candidatus Micrarchaeia archaeon]|jgi:hypothetical protein
MHLFDPLRPACLNSLPSLLNFPSAVPAIYIHLKKEGFALAVFLPTSPQGYGMKTYKLSSLEEIPSILEAWLQDPEGTAMKYFGWNPEEAKTKSSSPKPSSLTLDDIGL